MSWGSNIYISLATFIYHWLLLLAINHTYQPSTISTISQPFKPFANQIFPFLPFALRPTAPTIFFPFPNHLRSFSTILKVALYATRLRCVLEFSSRPLSDIHRIQLLYTFLRIRFTSTINNTIINTFTNIFINTLNIFININIYMFVHRLTLCTCPLFIYSIFK